jgi:putative ABC transport system permease protein
VLKEFPSNTDMDFNFLTNITCMRKIVGNWIDQPWAAVLKTYILFANNIDNKEFEKKVSHMVKNHFEEWYVSGFENRLQNIRDQHLYSSNIKFDFEYSGDISNIYMFTFIAIFILIIACVNYINISTSTATMRYKEIGIRRVMGATSKQIVIQFLCESLFISIMALVCSLFLVNISFHFIKFLPIKETANISIIDWRTILSLSILLLFITLVSGGIIAKYMAGVDPSKVLNGSIKLNFKNPFFRHILVTFQFLVAITLMICVTIIYRQYSFMRDKELGFDKQSLITLDFPSNYNEYKVFKNSILNNRNILQVTASDMVPPVFGIGNIVPLDPSYRKDLPIVLYLTDHDFINTLGLKVIKGRDISESFTTDEKEAVVINEVAAKELGWSDPIGKRLKINEDGKERCTIIGLVKDFHYSSLYEKIAPLAITVCKNRLSSIIIKVRTNDMKSTLKYVKGKWEEVFPILPFSYSFVQDDFSKRYEKEEKFFHLFSFFSMIAIVIACLGLFGLSSYSTECRKKEIGIRKVVGASVSQIVSLICKEFFFIVIIANIVAWPIAYYFMRLWLQRFAYKIELDLWLFLAPGLIVVLLSAVTVGYHSIKAAINNPTISIKCE